VNHNFKLALLEANWAGQDDCQNWRRVYLANRR